jgi:hypothetical protein
VRLQPIIWRIFIERITQMTTIWVMDETLSRHQDPFNFYSNIVARILSILKRSKNLSTKITNIV